MPAVPLAIVQRWARVLVRHNGIMLKVGMPALLCGIILKWIWDRLTRKKSPPMLETRTPVIAPAIEPTPPVACSSSSSSSTGAEFKAEMADGALKFGVFLNSASTTIAEQFAHAGYDWLLIDCQHGPMDARTLSAMLCAIASGGANSMVRVAGYDDRNGIQQALDLGADGILVPYINTADEAKAAVSCCLYPTAGTRSVYFPQRSMNKAGLLGYAAVQNDNVIIALQVETADCIKNMEEICDVPRVDMLFLGQNDLCMSMGLFTKRYNFTFPEMYSSP
eukprot:SAG11_NODE_2252_length_3631_cov_2.469706_3_plen_278_part_00